ncbi:MAG: hypothetical protein ACREU3_04325 [Steroidobacteraceae bacterium]
MSAAIDSDSVGARRIRASEPEDAAAIAALMSDAGLRPNVDPQHLYWKYWQEREDWPGSRSYVLTDGNNLLAHGALVPAYCSCEPGRLRIVHMIDWAARRSEPGAGVTLMKYIGNLADGLLGIGGSAATLKIMPLLGYRPYGLVTGYVRPLHPLRLLSGVAEANWKVLPRVARSALWRLTAPRPVRGEWRAQRIAAGEVGQIASVLPTRGREFDLLERTEALMRHTLACPIVPVELYALERSGRLQGYFLLTYAPGQARLVDSWVASDEAADWRALIQCAVLEASRNGGAAELVTWANDSLLAQSLIECGFRARLTLPVYLRATTPGVAPGLLRVQMLDNDAAYLREGRPELWA